MKKFSIIFTLSILFSFMIAGVASANFSAVSGTVEDSKTTTAWVHGGTVTVWDCIDIDGAALGIGPIAVDGTFLVPISPPVPPIIDRFLCVEFNFNTGGIGTPGDKWKVVNDTAASIGIHDLGVIYTDTGPTAVTLASFNSTQPTAGIPVTITLFIALGGVSYALLHRRRQTS